MGIYTSSLLRKKYLLEIETGGQEVDSGDTATDYTADDGGNDNAGGGDDNAADNNDTANDDNAGDDNNDNADDNNDNNGDDTGDDDGGDDEDPPDYTEGGDDDGGDDNGDGGGDNNSSSSTSSYSGGGGAASDSAVSDLKAKEEEISSLTPEQLDIKHRELKNQYAAMHDVVMAAMDRLSDISAAESNISTVEYVTNSLGRLDEMLIDYINYTYQTKSYIENAINYNRFLYYVLFI